MKDTEEKKDSYCRFQNIPKNIQSDIIEILRDGREIKSDSKDKQGRKVVFGKKGKREKK